MGIGSPPHKRQDRVDESEADQFFHDILSTLEEDIGFGEDESSARDDEASEHPLSLLEENARLRGLVVMLSNLVLRFVVDQN